ncbi:DDE_3 domain-containing protein [Trichonephila clavipes]|nr:DDE_3 domain-containing protein [Trichonephila clavipes]
MESCYGKQFHVCDRRSTLLVIPNTPTANLFVSLITQPILLPFMINILRGVFLEDNICPHTSVVTQRALQSVDMLLLPARSPHLSPIEHIELLPWPAGSPDLSPIKNMWSMLAQRLAQSKTPALTPDQLFNTWKPDGLLYRKNTSRASMILYQGVCQELYATLTPTLTTDFVIIHMS